VDHLTSLIQNRLILTGTPAFEAPYAAPIVVSADPHLPPDVPVQHRIIELIKHATAQAVEPVASTLQLPVDLFFAGPEERPGLDSDLSARVLAALEDSLAHQVPLGERILVWGGRSAGPRALSLALERLMTGQTAACLWCGADSCLAPATLDWLDTSGLLHAGGARWGFIPGEAASACLLLESDLAEGEDVRSFGILRAPHRPQIFSVARTGALNLGHTLSHGGHAKRWERRSADRLRRLGRLTRHIRHRALGGGPRAPVLRVSLPTIERTSVLRSGKT
jgi:hypothetical protein